MKAIVVGCGISGLSSALRLVESGASVAIWARELPPHTTSNVAGAIWYPYRSGPAERVARWARETYVELRRLAVDPASGVVMREGVELFPERAEPAGWREDLEDLRRAGEADLPPGFRDGWVFRAPIVEMDVYLERLMRRFASAGGTVVQREVAQLGAALEEADVVVNCSGLGARELAGDRLMIPVRGQVVRTPRLGIERFLLDDSNAESISYVLPRVADCILGSTVEPGREDCAPDPQATEAILARCADLEPRLRRARVLGVAVGLRPGRPEVRLEAEEPRPGQLLVHNYGHGGAGVTLSWGCANEVLELAAIRPSGGGSGAR
jgi:D-amino-acid oxidase